MEAWLLVTLLGLAYGLPQIAGLVQPDRFAALVQRFPRSALWGNVLMPLGTLWFLWNLRQDSVADFAAFKPIMFIGFSVVGFGTCVFVRDFLAVRGLAVVTLLLAHLVLRQIQWIDSSWRLVVTTWAYLGIFGAIWVTISPWRLRDYLGIVHANERRTRIASGIRLAFGLLVALIGLTALRAAQAAGP